MSDEITIEQVKALVEQATMGPWAFNFIPERQDHWIEDPWIIDPPIGGNGPIAEVEGQDNAELIAAAPSLARLTLSLHDQLQHEREARAGLERVAEEARGVFELAGPFPSHHIETMSENWGIRPSVGGNIRLRDLGEALDALARPAQTDAGEGKA